MKKMQPVLNSQSQDVVITIPEGTMQFEVTEADNLSEFLSLTEAIGEVRSKIQEDLFRFRTCCADPRASK